MDIFDFAMQMEQDGEQLYRQLASQTANPGVQRILNMLADDEVKHYHIVRQMKQNADPQMSDTAILANAKNVFTGMVGTEFDLQGIQLDLYRKAQEIERKSQTFYAGKAQEAQKPGHKQLLLKLADEEERHFFLLDHMIEFISRPYTWIEDAEFNHLEAY